MSGIIGGAGSKSGVIDTLSAGTFNGTLDSTTFSGDAGQKTAKAWLRITNSSTTPTIVDSYNVSSVAAFAYSRWKVNWSSAQPSANYTVVGCSGSGTGTVFSVNVYNASYIELYLTSDLGGTPTASTPYPFALVLLGD